MRIYTTWELAYDEIKRDLFNNSVKLQSNRVQDQDVSDNPEFEMREVIGYLYCLDNVRSTDVLKTLPFEQTEYIFAEFRERVGKLGHNPGQSYLKLKDLWTPFLHDGRFSYNYPERIGDQVSRVINLLKFDPVSRQAVVSIWDRVIDKTKVGIERVPCSLVYMFVIRNEKLDMTYIMRSQDAKTFICIDVALALKIQEYIASELKIKPGRFLHFINSLHIFKKDIHENF